MTPGWNAAIGVPAAWPSSSFDDWVGSITVLCSRRRKHITTKDTRIVSFVVTHGRGCEYDLARCPIQYPSPSSHCSRIAIG